MLVEVTNKVWRLDPSQYGGRVIVVAPENYKVRRLTTTLAPHDIQRGCNLFDLARAICPNPGPFDPRQGVLFSIGTQEDPMGDMPVGSARLGIVRARYQTRTTPAPVWLLSIENRHGVQVVIADFEPEERLRPWTPSLWDSILEED